MKKYLRKMLSMVVCLALIVSTGIRTQAASESNILGVTFEATLDTPNLSVSTEDQTVVMQLKASQGITMNAMGLTITQDSPLVLTNIAGGDEKITINAGNYNLENGQVGWNTYDLEDITDVTDLLTVTFTVHANTPAGTYNVGVKEMELAQGYDVIAWETSATATATLTLTEAVVTEGYTANVTSLTNEISVEDTVTVNVGIAHSSDTTFAAGEIVLNYDNTKLAFNQGASTLGTATVKDNAGIITLEDYGADKAFSTAAYVLAFDAIAAGQATVTMTSAAFVDREDAVKSDLIAATISAESVALTISKKTYAVTLPDFFTGPVTVTDGEAYTFSVTDGVNYDYNAVAATVDGNNVNVVDNGDGTYTVENVTGVLVITGSRTEKNYSVTFAGNAADDITDGASTATYNTDYTFTMPSASGWAYSLESITIGGITYTGYAVADSVYTISGSAINGNIIITVNKSATETSVTVEGSGAGAAAGYEVKANIGDDYTLEIVPESGYIYTVTAVVGGESATVVDNGDNTYTIKAVTDNITFTVERTVDVEGVSVSEYLTLDGSVMWLVLNDTTLAANKVPTYDGENMYWSEKYGTYCYLTVASTLNAEEVAAKVGITDGTAVNVEYGMDVNKTGKIDASDAQLVYNMYNAVYAHFTTDATVEKFLRADVNSDSKINIEDATAIIANLLN